MSAKIQKKSLGTVVECSETADDCASLLVDGQPQIPNVKSSDSTSKRPATTSDPDVEAGRPSSSEMSGKGDESPHRTKRRKFFGFKRSSGGDQLEHAESSRDARRNPIGVRIADLLNNLTPGIGVVYQRLEQGAREVTEPVRPGNIYSSASNTCSISCSICGNFSAFPFLVVSFPFIQVLSLIVPLRQGRTVLRV
uniref:RBR-type E3 ubiquitin transferase n=1 Tax=Steinernema glaseri TaxID=37863 RepID=A0A1I7YW60_9BILA